MIKYKVFDKKTKKDITDKYPWVITPEGKLFYDSFEYPDAEIYYMFGETPLNVWDSDRVFDRMIEKSWVSYSSPHNNRLIWLDDVFKVIKEAIK